MIYIPKCLICKNCITSADDLRFRCNVYPDGIPDEKIKVDASDVTKNTDCFIVDKNKCEEFFVSEYN